MPEFGGLALGLILLMAATLAALVLPSLLDAPVWRDAAAGAYTVARYAAISSLVNVVLGFLVPQAIALGMLWIAFIKANRGDRYLWNAVMIVSAGIVAELFDVSIAAPRHRIFAPSLGTTGANVWIVSGTIAYAALHFTLSSAGYRRLYASLAVAVMVCLYVVPVFLGGISWLTLLCSLAVSLGIWAIGVWIAEQVGFDPYAADDEAI